MSVTEMLKSGNGASCGRVRQQVHVGVMCWVNEKGPCPKTIAVGIIKEEVRQFFL